MRTIRIAILLGALTAGAVATAPAHAEDVECRGTLGAIAVKGTVLVPDDATCELTGTQIDGSIVVKSRATLLANGVNATGSLAGEGPLTVDVRRSTIGNNTSVKKSEPGGRIVFDGNSITGDIQLADNRGPITVNGNPTVGGSIQAEKNTGGLTITGNVIGNALQCQQNNPAPAGSGNSAKQFQGQCPAPLFGTTRP